MKGGGRTGHRITGNRNTMVHLVWANPEQNSDSPRSPTSVCKRHFWLCLPTHPQHPPKSKKSPTLGNRGGRI